MAFDAIVSLKREIEKYLIRHETLRHTSIREILEFAYEQVESSQEVAKRMFGIAERSLVIEIKNAAYRLSKTLNSLVSEKIDVEGIHNLENEIHFFTATMKKLEGDYADEFYKSLLEVEGEGRDEKVVSTVLVGLTNQYSELRERLIVQGPTKLKILSLIGMQGIGKTSLSRKIFDDPLTIENFDYRVWVKIGLKCRLKEVASNILAQLKRDRMCVDEEEDDEVWCLNESLRGKKYLIVLDDVWDKYIAAYLQIPVYSRRGNELKNHFPDEENGSRILLTSRLQQADESNLRTSGEIMEMRLMNKEESWDLLSEKVFGEEPFCWELEKLGMKIAEKCDGLPLTILTVANLLCQAEKTTHYWNEVATRKNHQLFKAAYDEISKVLFPWYKNLPTLLQMCFMYIGVFPKKYEIPQSKLVNLWKADGFLGLNRDEYPNLTEMQCLHELASNCMVMICKKTSMVSPGVCKGIKICRLHSSLWHLSNREATRSKFSYILSVRNDVCGDGIKGQRRLSFHNNILFGVKGLNTSMEEKCASTTHSVLCYGPYLRYQVPLCSGLMLLRKLDALTIRFYEFPIEVLQLIQLRYLALTLDGKLPAAIVRLSKLRFLIVDQHLSIKYGQDMKDLPMEIWNMKELQHVEVVGNDFLNPCGASLESLLTLLRVSPNSCTKEVFRAIPKLEKLGIQVELSPGDDEGEPFRCIDHISHLSKLWSLKCVVVNPKAAPSFAPLPTFPMWLRKLSLNGLGYAWEEMSKLECLLFLTVLKLRSYACQGPYWEVSKDGFRYLQTLVIEDTDLMRWKVGGGSFHWLGCLVLKSCYNLTEFDGEFGEHLKEIEMVDCNPLGTEQIKEAASVEVRVSCSWFDKKHKA